MPLRVEQSSPTVGGDSLGAPWPLSVLGVRASTEALDGWSEEVGSPGEAELRCDF